MINRTLILYIPLILILSTCADKGDVIVQPSSASGKQWMLQPEYSDEFNQTKLDLIKWNNDVYDWGVWSWEPENTWVGDGNLHLRIQYNEHQRDGETLFYKSGIIKSKASPIMYGYFEARIKAAQRFPGVSPAFWVYRGEKEMWTEIDFVELTQKSYNINAIDGNTHVFRHPKLPDGEEMHEHRTWQAPWDPRDEFHIYGCEWNEKEIKWYVDGKLVKSRENEYWHQALDVILSFGIRSPLKKKPSSEAFPTIYDVDYVRVWKRNKFFMFRLTPL